MTDAAGSSKSAKCLPSGKVSRRWGNCSKGRVVACRKGEQAIQWLTLWLCYFLLEYHWGRRWDTAAERTRHTLVLYCKVAFLVTLAALCYNCYIARSHSSVRLVSTKALLWQLSLFFLCLEGIKAVLSDHSGGFSLPSFHFPLSHLVLMEGCWGWHVRWCSKSAAEGRTVQRG